MGGKNIQNADGGGCPSMGNSHHRTNPLMGPFRCHTFPIGYLRPVPLGGVPGVCSHGTPGSSGRPVDVVAWCFNEKARGRLFCKHALSPLRRTVLTRGLPAPNYQGPPGPEPTKYPPLQLGRSGLGLVGPELEGNDRSPSPPSWLGCGALGCTLGRSDPLYP